MINKNYSIRVSPLMGIALTMLMLVAGITNRALAQINNYSFTTSSGTFTSIVDPANALTLNDWNSGRTGSVIPAFPFIYEGKQIYDLRMSANGFIGMSFSSTTPALSVTTTAETKPFAGGTYVVNNVIAPFACNLIGNSGSSTSNVNTCYAKTEGTSPNRVLTLEWNNVSVTGSGNIIVPASASFQVKLYEGSNMIEFVYGTFTTGIRTASVAAQIGLKGASKNAYNMLALNGTTWTSVTASGDTTNTVTAGTGTDQLPVSGQIFRFTPESNCSGVPTAGTASKSPISFCTSGSFNLGLSGYQKNVYTSFQWQTSTDGLTGWTNTSSVDTVPLSFKTPVISSTRYYRCKATCLATSDSSFSNVIEALIGDTIKPSVVPASNINVSTDAGLCTASIAVPNATVTDNCTVASVTYAITGATTASGSAPVGTQTFNKGTSVITYTATDAAGNVNTASMTVTVNDTELPVITASNVSVSTDLGLCTASVTITDAVITDNCSVSDYSYTITGVNTGSGIGQVGTLTFNKGVSTITYSAQDVNGNTNSHSITVTVSDTEHPTVSASSAISVNTDAGQCNASVVVPDATIADNCPGVSVSYTMTGATTKSITPGQVGTYTFNKGVTTITYQAADASGNMSSASSMTVTVSDNESPVAIAQDITIYLSSGGAASITASDINNGSSDNCSFSLSASKTSFGCGDVGGNTVTLSVTDPSSNVSTATAIVTVIDTVKPVAIKKNITVYLDSNGAASITASDIDNGSSDACTVSLSASKTSFGCADVGPNSVTLTVTDPSNNFSTANATVTVVDTVKPVVQCKNITVALDASGAASIVSADINDNTTDACGGLSFTLSKSSFNCSNVGPNTVTLTATDVNGNVSSNTAVVTVIDTIKPVAISKNISVYLDAAGAASIVAADINDNSTDACGGLSLSASKTSFGCSDLGVNTVTLSVTDVNNNVSTATATVTVIDTIKPVASCKNFTVTLSGAGSASIVASDIDNGSADACGVTLSASKTTFSCSDLGANTVTLTVTDPSSNVSTCTATVTVLNAIAAPTAISGSVNACLPGIAGSATFSTAAVPSATSYVWEVPSGMSITSGQGTNSIVVGWTAASIQAGITGQICVKAVNSCGPTSFYCQNVSYQVAAPITPGSISGTGKLCPGEQVTFSIATVARATSYSWTLPANMTVLSGAGTNVITASVDAGYTGGTVSVTASNICGTSPARSKSITTNLPSAPSAINGTKEGLCNATAVVYSIATVSNAVSYTWTVSGGSITSGQGTTSITVNFGVFASGSVSVVANNGCGTSAQRVATLKGSPARAGEITGSAAVCTGDSLEYSVATVPGASTYAWSMTSAGYISAGNGTKTINVKWLSTPATNQVLSVNSSNACGTSTNRTLSAIAVTSCPRLEASVGSFNFTMFPNPASENVSLVLNAEKQADYLVQVMDVTGRVVFAENMSAMQGVNTMNISLGHLVSGFYNVVLTSGKEMSSLKLLVD